MRLLTDPVLRRRIGPLARIGASAYLQTLGELDCVLLSHLHADHVDLPSLRAVAGRILVLAPFGAGAWLRRRGLRDVRELSCGETISIGDLQIRATPAVHDGRRRPLGPRALALGYIVKGSVTVYFAGDTDLFPGMAELHGLVDVALLPIAGWGPTLGPGHLDPERAARAAAMIAPRVAVPIHWGTFVLRLPGARDADARPPADAFAALVKRDAPDVEVRLLAPGKRLEL
jgi:L-ascorbate metabolism protein UlaG (beta-lactamase superfamily)